MKYKCLIVDDEDLARDLIENHLSNLDEFELVASCSSALEARKILQDIQVDLLFLDIEMPLLKGTEFFKNLNTKPSVIFTTAYRDYAIEGFELSAVDYLLKPITFDRFIKATDKFLNQKNYKPSKSKIAIEKPGTADIFIRKDRKQVKVFLDDILYVESLKDYVKVHLPDEVYTVKYTLSNFYEMLDKRFLRIHRSFVINTDKVTAYTKQDVEIGLRELPIGESYAKTVSDYFLK